jgi:hypothetical protein
MARSLSRICTNCSQRPSQPIAIPLYPVLVEGNVLLQYMDNARILHAIEMTYLVDKCITVTHKQQDVSAFHASGIIQYL